MAVAEERDSEAGVARSFGVAGHAVLAGGGDPWAMTTHGALRSDRCGAVEAGGELLTVQWSPNVLAVRHRHVADVTSRLLTTVSFRMRYDGVST